MIGRVVLFLCGTILTCALKDVIFVVDGSGSVDAVDWSIQRDGIVAVLQDALRIPRDGSYSIGVVQYSSYAKLEISPIVVSSQYDIDMLVQAVENMVQIRGGTVPSTGVQLANGLSGYRDNVKREYCLVTDGPSDSGMYTAMSQGVAQGLDRFSVVGIIDGSFGESQFHSNFDQHVVGDGKVHVVLNTVQYAAHLGSTCFPSKKLKLEALEVLQVVQTLNNTIPLYEKKKTLVRAYIDSTDGSKVRATAELCLTTSGASKKCVSAENPGSVEAASDSTSRRSKKSATLNFVLPAHMITVGSATFELVTVGEDIECADNQQNCKTAVIDIKKSTSIPLQLYSITHEDSAPSINVLNNVYDRMSAIFPIQKLYQRSPRQISLSGILLHETLYTKLLEMRLHNIDHESEVFYMGILHESKNTIAGKYRPKGFGDAENKVGYASPHSMKNTYTYHTASHELAHMFGLWHAGVYEIDGILLGLCDSKAPKDEKPFPYVYDVMIDKKIERRPTLGPLGQDKKAHVYGWDSLNDEIISPFERFELMSYCGPEPRWISEDTYKNVAQKVEPSGGFLRNAIKKLLKFFVFFMETNSDGQLVSQVVSIGEVYTDIIYPDLPFGNFSVIFASSSTNNSAIRYFDPSAIVDDDVSDETMSNKTGFITVFVDSASSYDSVIVQNDNNETQYEMRASPHAPVVNVLYPNGGESLWGDVVDVLWNASDADGDSLLFSIFYSGDNGQSWEALESSLQNTSLSVELSTLGKTEQGLFRVQVTDGFNVGHDVSDSTFVTPNVPPAVYMMSPADDHGYIGLEMIVFEATAYDREDGALDGGSVSWISSVDGAIGVGTVLERSADDLTEGVHWITVRATDSVGVTTSSPAVKIVIFRIAPPQTISPSAAPTFTPTTALKLNAIVGSKRHRGEVKVKKPGKKGEDKTDVHVFLLGNDFVNVATIDISTLQLGDAGQLKQFEKKKKKGKGDKKAYELKDEDGDGKDDLGLIFSNVGVQCGDTALTLTGSLLSGEEIEAVVYFNTTGKECSRRLRA